MNHTPSPPELAYIEFSKQKLVQLSGGVDKASFIAEYETAQGRYSDLLEALEFIVNDAQPGKDA